jgi:hypothetical protein
VEGELWKLGEDKQSPRRERPKLVWVGIVGFVLICAATGMLVARAKSVKAAGNAAARGTPAVHLSSGLKVIDKRVAFATGTIQALDLQLPCSGSLSISVSFPKETCVSVFLVPPEERAKMQAGKAFKHVPGFDAKTTSGTYLRSAQLPAGRYAMVLLDESGSRSVVQVNAHLRGLK